MLVSQVISLAKSSELRQLAVKDDNEAIIGFINLGMLELHKRFSLKAEEAIVTMQAGRHTYRLDGGDSSVNITEPENLLLVTYCSDEEGKTVSINKDDDALGIRTPTYNTIDVVTPVAGKRISVVYRASTQFVTSITDNINIPPQLLESLLHYIGYRGNTTVSADIKAENNTHYIRFDQSCTRVVNQGLVFSDSIESSKFAQRGFV